MTCRWRRLIVSAYDQGLFLVDFEGHADDPVVRKALDELSTHCLTMTVLGSYPKANPQEGAPEP